MPDGRHNCYTDGRRHADDPYQQARIRRWRRQLRALHGTDQPDSTGTPTETEQRTADDDRTDHETETDAADRSKP